MRRRSKKLPSFEDLEFEPHALAKEAMRFGAGTFLAKNDAMDGFLNHKRAVMYFDNLYGVSVISELDFGYPSGRTFEGLWEIGIMEKYRGLTYDTPLTDDVIRMVTPDEVTEVMRRVQALERIQCARCNHQLSKGQVRQGVMICKLCKKELSEEHDTLTVSEKARRALPKLARQLQQARAQRKVATNAP